MPRQTEDLFRKVQEYLKNYPDEIRNEEDLNRIIAEYMLEYNQNTQNHTANHSPQTSDDYLELAEEASSHKKCIEYLNKALELDSDNIDAARMLIDETVKDPIEALEKYKALIKKGAKILDKQGYFDHNQNHEFWLAFDTRPYMRARYWYMKLLIDCGMIRQATLECKEMLKLCRSDNLGVRYDLMHLYALLEDESAATKLFKQYQEISAHFILPYSILYFKLGDFNKSAKLLKDLAEENKDTKKFFRIINSKNSSSMDKYIQEMNPYGEKFNSIDELLGEINNYSYLTVPTLHYFKWANNQLKKK